MSSNLRLSLILGIFVYLIIILWFLRKKAINLKYSILWIFSAILLLVMCIFPQLVENMAGLMGFEAAVNEIFILFIFFILLILISLTSIVSKQQNQIKAIVQSLALLEKDVRDIINQHKNSL